MKTNPSFAQLFKFFRVKSGFKTISHFSKALSAEGFTYDNSLFSHWQRGSRVPSNRKLILVLIKIFTETSALKYEDQANLILKSTNKKDWTPSEEEKISLLRYKKNPPSWNEELEKFILAENLNKKLKPEKGNSTNGIIRFNFSLSKETHSYFEKTSKENNVSKAGFIRQLIEKHKDSNFDFRIE